MGVRSFSLTEESCETGDVEPGVSLKWVLKSCLQRRIMCPVCDWATLTLTEHHLQWSQPPNQADGWDGLMVLPVVCARLSLLCVNSILCTQVRFLS